jgi:predicted AlkP superfamily phosphohydrolase/phosphomutase
MGSKKVVIGLDGVPYKLIENLTASGVMPNAKKIINDGIFVKMKSTLPEISSVSWSSIITGKNPGEHGVFGFTELIPGTYTLSFPNFNSLRAKPFWHLNKKKKYVICNVPFTYPAQELNGYLISGFVAPKLEKAVYPYEFLESLESIGYETDVDSTKAHKSMDLFVRNLFKVLEIRKKTYRILWDKVDWDVFFFVITGTDRLMHFLWDAYENSNHKYHEAFIDFFKETDNIIGEIYSKNNNENLTIISDHGFSKAKTSVNLNQYLFENDFLALDSSRSRNSYKSVQAESLAFALDPSRIYLHYNDKYPEGKVQRKDREKILDELIDLFSSFNYNGKKVIKKVFRQEDIYAEKYLEKAPDLVLLPEEGFMLKGNVDKEKIFEKDIFTGKHSYEDAIFINSEIKEIPFEESLMSVEHVLGLIGISNLKQEEEQNSA